MNLQQPSTPVPRLSQPCKPAITCLALTTATIFGLSSSVLAQTDPVSGKTPIHRTTDSVPTTNESGRATSSGSTLIVLGGLLAAAVVVRRVIQKKVERDRTCGSAKPISLVDRQQIDGDFTVRLLQVGRRLLVVGSSSQGLATLAEITDPEEVALLRGESPNDVVRDAGSGMRATEENTHRASRIPDRLSKSTRTAVTGGV